MEKQMKILMVDDDSAVGSFKRALESNLEGCRVVVIRSADDCLAFTGDRSVDLVILDMMMYPGSHLEDADTNNGFTTGLALLSHIEKVQPGTPVVVFTALRPPHFEHMSETCRNHHPSVVRVWRKPKENEEAAREIMDLVAAKAKGAQQ